MGNRRLKSGSSSAFFLYTETSKTKIFILKGLANMTLLTTSALMGCTLLIIFALFLIACSVYLAVNFIPGIKSLLKKKERIKLDLTRGELILGIILCLCGAILSVAFFAMGAVIIVLVLQRLLVG